MRMVAIATLLLSFRAAADLLVRFPAGTAEVEMAAVGSALRGALGVPVATWDALAVAEAPAPAPPDEARAALDGASAAYKRLEFDSALQEIAAVEKSCLAAPVLDPCRPLLFDAHVLRGMIAVARGDRETADLAFLSAHAAQPTRVLDPRLYPPTVIRAFSRACADVQQRPAAEVEIASTPAGAVFRLDGAILDSRRPAVLAPGSHVLEAALPGFAPSRRVIDVSAAGVGPKSIVIDLAPLPEAAARDALRGLLADPAIDLGRGDLLPLCSRFRFDRVILLERDVKEASFSAEIGAAGETARRSLPSLDIRGGALPADFETALRGALGLAAAKAAAGPPLTPARAPADDDEDDESSQIRERPENMPGQGTPPETETSDAKRLLRSPWLWVSVGAVLAVVAGVVIATQVDD